MGYTKIAEVWRGPAVESVHYGAAAVANAQGEVLFGWGDPAIVTFPRSSLKPIQAVGLVETGAAAALRLEARHIALACASHLGESIHTELVQAWLQRLDLSEGALACGPDYPRGEEDVAALIRAGRPKSRIFHNCSGKHCGFLTLARHMGWPVEGYNDAAHPGQQHYFDVLSELLGREARALPLGVDGCTLPAPALPIADMARAMARHAGLRVSSPVRQAALRSIHEAMRHHPEYVAGAKQPNVAIAQATGGRVIMKGGAEGYLIALIPEQGLGIALKVADGNSRARVIAFLAILRELKLLSETEIATLAPLAESTVYDSSGNPAGRIRACHPHADCTG